MFRTARERVLTVLLLAAIVSFTAGCGSDMVADTEPHRADDFTPVAFAFAGPLSGTDADRGLSMLRGAQLAFEQANATQEVRTVGYEFVVRATDDKGESGRAAYVATLLAADPQVMGVIGHLGSACSLAAAPIYEDAGLAMLTVSGDPRLTSQGFRCVCRMVATDEAQGSHAATLLSEKLSMSRVFVVTDASEYGLNVSGAFADTFARAGGEVVSRETIASDQVDFTALVDRIAGLAPQAVYFSGARAEAVLLSATMAGADLDVPLVGTEALHSQEYIDAVGPAQAEGDIITHLGSLPAQSPRGADFTASYMEAWGVEPRCYDAYAYDQAWILVRAVLDAGLDRKGIMDAVRSGSFEGVTGVTGFDENGDTTNPVVSAFQVHEGRWVLFAE